LNFPYIYDIINFKPDATVKKCDIIIYRRRRKMNKVVVFTAMLFLAVLSAMAAQGPEWTFDGPDAAQELKNWVDLNQLEPLKIETVKDQDGLDRKVLITKSLGGDPYMFPGGGWNQADYDSFSGKEHPVLYLGVRVNTPNRWQIYWVSKEDGNWSEAQHQDFDVNAVDEFQDIEVEITAGDWQKKTILRFRIDPGTSAGVEAEIDYISFNGPISTGKPGAVDPKDKLATTWARIKK